MIDFITKRIKSVKYAFKGAYLLVTTEASVKVQAFIAIVMTIAGFAFDISRIEWIIQIFTIALIMSIEGLNTAVEKIADFIHPEHHQKIGFIKDIAAGAVFITAIAAIIIGCFIYLPKFF
ncbi:diacylglycerol kinase (ATP) [Pustulibacterium marinum]|uniref:Diacylglycerol kinase (ATP) n=1 Tax=Pustulibacterium marinum TaxID=1224947 RepID=A0A1I7ING0_9FLAO|nr:diacylglycerol kinase family protein [Pustulibacterium marinum]SFU74463.1 diacylglycerol kinase (ATP) [Pustulibacterium marinum]